VHVRVGIPLSTSLLELGGRATENGGSKPTAKVVGWWVTLFSHKHTGDLLVELGFLGQNQGVGEA